jgi:uncharacterized iron-regulated protein
VLPFGAYVRLVTHHEISENSVQATLEAVQAVLLGEDHGAPTGC